MSCNGTAGGIGCPSVGLGSGSAVQLTSVGLLGVLLLLAATASGVAVRARRLWPGHPVALRVGCGVLVLLLTAATAGAAVNRHFGLYRSWGDLFGVQSRDLVLVPAGGSLTRVLAALPVNARRPTHGTLVEVHIPGLRSGIRPRDTFVYLPPQYRDPAYAGRAFPVVEAFQGSPGRPSDWIRGARADQELDRGIMNGWLAPQIVVFPDINGGLSRSLECVDTTDGIRDETFLTVDVRDWVAGHLRAAPGRWVAMGYSTGAYCALDLAFRHPSLYVRAISLDGYVHGLQDHYARNLCATPADRLAHSPDWWITAHRPEPVDVYLLAGTLDESTARDYLRFWRQLGAAGWRRPYDALVAQLNGTHTFPAWQQALVPALAWALPGALAPHAGVRDDTTALQRAGLVAVGRCSSGYRSMPITHAPLHFDRRSGQRRPFVRCFVLPSHHRLRRVGPTPTAVPSSPPGATPAPTPHRRADARPHPATSPSPSQTPGRTHSP